MYYVYKYVLDDEVIYVGKTKDLTTRIGAHGGLYDNIKAQYRAEVNKADVFFCTFDSEGDMNIMEGLLISKYKPKCNVQQPTVAIREYITSFNEPDWQKYEPQKTYAGENVTLSVRVDKTVKADWQAYCKTKGLVIGEATKEAFALFMGKNPLNGKEEEIHRLAYEVYMM